MDKRLILVTVPNRDVAERITSALLSERLVACVSIVPGIESHYIWEGRTETSTELLLMMKTRIDLFDAVRDRVVSLHPYQVPEIVALPIDRGSLPYLQWIDDVVGPPRGDR
ncbi:MAG TPA: divalent-cation tolerance protein CutA [Candidatus Ozemobacteraceae bacterium]|nr:divalent-cation tolerance protein CutA [Candidatus Ozemobacteraceae bacterium]